MIANSQPVPIPTGRHHGASSPRRRAFSAAMQPAHSGEKSSPSQKITTGDQTGPEGRDGAGGTRAGSPSSRGRSNGGSSGGAAGGSRTAVGGGGAARCGGRSGTTRSGTADA